MRHEISIAKIATAILIILTLISIARADERVDAILKPYRLAPKGLSEIIIEAGKKYNIDPSIIAAIIVTESSANPKAVSKGGDYGLMQIRWKVHRRSYPQLKTATDLFNPRTNVFIGTEIFARYYAQKKTLRGALLRYSGGNTNMANKVIKELR